MNYRTELYKRLFSDLLPEWSKRCGYIQGYIGWERIFPEHIVPIPVELAPASSLDGLFIDIEHSPKSIQILSSYIQTILPGGIAIAHLSKKYWNKKKIKNTFHIAGFEIIFLAQLYSIEQVYYEDGYFHIKSFLPRIFLYLFSFIPVGLKSNYFVIAKKKFHKNPTGNETKLSVILILPSDLDLARQKLISWYNYLSSKNLHYLEIIIVEGSESVSSNIEFSDLSNTQRLKIHNHNDYNYSIYTGIYKSSGKIIYVDASENPETPHLFLEVLDIFLKKNQNHKPFAIYVFSKRANFFKRKMNQFFVSSFSKMFPIRIYNQKSKEVILKFHPFVLKKQPDLIEKEILKHGKLIKLFKDYDMNY
ncbi:MAG: hypothetical protein NZ853_02090 [Leptospiraceae bacterium]|nr:hypothetical protein [Leptospiraceae bacterium]MDW7975984.1 hypothetical protein [Leptospiraceae bacterium]